MARVWLALHLLFFLFKSTLCLDVSQIHVLTNDGISEVFLVQTKSKVYSFNATTAKEACEAIQMRIAKTAEVETANKNGFQTCRFGWVEDKIAVIPRVERNEKCGQNNVGVYVWKADISKKFDVYCFKPAGHDGSLQTTSSRPQPTRGGRTSSNIYYSTTTTHPSTIKSASLPAYTSTPFISFTFNTSSTTFRTHSLSTISSQATTNPQSLSSPRTSPKVSTSLPSSSSHSSTHFLLQHSSPSTGQPVPSQTTTPNRPSIRAAPKTLIIFSVVLFFTLAAAGSAWYIKIKRRQQVPSWIRMRPKQITEMEMWKQISERHWMSEQTGKVNNNRKCNNIILQMDQDPSAP